ncbi:MAG: T9SS type A sorting domain-containing protein [Candidatus Tenebribacter mawsonii]|nr:T9SS type A sorting domain-containing protein [Candidatus Tenebribacter mawsonii]
MKIFMILLTITIILFPLNLFSNGNMDSFEMGTSINRNMHSSPTGQHWHAGVFSSFRYGTTEVLVPNPGEIPPFIWIEFTGGIMQYYEMDKNGSSSAHCATIQTTGSITTNGISQNLTNLIDDTIGSFADGETYRGTYSRITEPHIRESIIATANDMINHNIGYCFMDMIQTNLIWNGWWWVQQWNGRISRINDMRCDAITEYSYEKHDVIVAMDDNITHSGMQHLHRHNDLHGGSTTPGSDELCPRIQAGDRGNVSEFDPLSAANPVLQDFSISNILNDEFELKLDISDNASMKVYVSIEIAEENSDDWQIIKDTNGVVWNFYPIDLTEYHVSPGQHDEYYVLWEGLLENGTNWNTDVCNSKFRTSIIDQGANYCQEITYPNKVFGNVSFDSGSGDITNVSIEFDSHNYTINDVSLNPDENGNFSHTFWSNEFDTYDITYEHDDYYPETIENVVINDDTTPLTLSNVTLHLISDQTSVIVSSNENIEEAFRTIQGAVDHFINQEIDGTIHVLPDVYDESVSWDTDISHIKVSGVDQETCIVEGDNAYTFTVIGTDCNENDIIENLTIRNGSAAIVNYGGVSIIRNNKFENSDCAIINYSPIKLQNNLFINNNSCLWSYQFDNLSTDYSVIEDNVFMQNTSEYPLITIDEMGYIDIRNNTFLDNTFDLDNDHTGSVIEFHTTDDSRSVYIEGNIFQNNNDVSSTSGSILSIDNNDPPNDINLSNNTFIENSAAAMINYSTVQTPKTNYNSIFKSNTIYGDNVINGEYLYCDYSLFYDNNANNGNCDFGDNIFEEDPLLDENNKPLWNSTSKSPCIDIGNGSNNPDGTPADIGAIPAVIHQYDIVELPSPLEDNGWKWLSFPALDNILAGADIAGYVLDDILDPTILDRVVAKNYIIEWIEELGEWENDYQQFQRTEGFKFHMNAAADLNVPGFKEYDNTTIVLDGNSEPNWIGYWLEETQSVEDAFSAYWNGSNITSITAQHWSAVKFLDTWFYRVESGYSPTLSYGDMVIVLCNTTITNFSWDNSTPEDPKVVFSESTYFTYEEQADYVPIFIEIDPDNIPKEIGAIVDGECIGATTVTDSTVQIRAYVSNVPPGDIELELYYGNRSENKTITSYKCISASDPHTQNDKIRSNKVHEAYFITLREDSNTIPEVIEFQAHNYPNPFNPTTTISYSLPLEGKVSLNVYNVKGQLVRQLIDGNQLEGHYEVVWNGKDNNGKSVSSGIYFYKLSTKDETIMKKMLMLK